MTGIFRTLGQLADRLWDRIREVFLPCELDVSDPYDVICVDISLVGE